GNESDPSPAITITVDTQAPATPAAPTEYLDNTDPQQGTFGTGTSTNDTTPGLIIPAPAAGETPKLYVDGTEVPATYDPATGTLTPNAPLGEGKHDLTYTLTDAAGNESAQSPALSLTVDTQAPTAPAAPTQYVDDAGTVTGQFGTGTSTDDTTPGLIIAAPGAGETPKLYVDGTEVPATYDPATGTLTPTTPLGEGQHDLTYTLTDEAGNESGQSPAITITVDTTAPTTPAAPTEYLDNTDPQQGQFASGTTTNDTTPGLIIAAPGAGETPKLYVDGTEVPATYDPATGTLTPTTPLTEGKHDLTYTLTDAVGNESAPSGALTLTVDTQAPDAPTAALVSDTGIPGDGVTSNGEVAVTLTDSGVDNWQYSTDGGVTWSTIQTAENNRFTLADGDYPAGQVQVREVDPAGNVSDAYSLGHLQVYNGAPPQPQAALVNDTGVDDNDQITTDGTLQITGILPGFTWSYSIDGGNTFIDGSSDNLLVLPVGSYDNIMISQVNDIGSSGQAWNTGPIEVVAPINLTMTLATDSGSSSSDGTTKVGTINVGGISDSPHSKAWEYSTDGGASWKEGTGTSFTLPSDGTYAANQIQVRQSNDAYTAPVVSKLNSTVVLDTQAPVAPTINTLDTSGTVSGVAEANAKITVSFADGSSQTVMASGTGAWSVNKAGGLVAGTSVTATATDLAGNISPVTSKGVAPVTPTTYLDNVNPSQGTFAAGTTTNDATPGLNVAAPASGQTLKLYVDGVAVAATYDSVTGTLTPTTGLGEGTHSLSYSIVDSSNNESARSGALSLTVDTIAPTATATITGMSDDTGTVGDWITTDHTLTITGNITGTLAAGEIVQISKDGINWINATVNGSTWSATDPATLATGNVTYQSRIVDAAQNATAVKSQTIRLVDLVGVNDLAKIDGTVKSGVTSNYTGGNLSVTIVDAGGILDNTVAQNMPTLTIQDGVTSNFTFKSGTLLGVGGGGAILDVVAYKYNPVTQAYEQVQKVSGAGFLAAFGLAIGTVTAAFTNLTGGTYKFVIASTLNFAGISVSGPYSYTDVTSTDYGPTHVGGNVLTNDTVHTGTVSVSAVSSEITSQGTKTIASGSSTSITGQHGTLTIKSDGTYDYVRLMDSSHLGKTDTFTITVKDQWSNTVNEQLNVQIGANGFTFSTTNPSADATGSAISSFAAFSTPVDTTPSNTTETSSSANDTFNSTASHHNTVIFNVLNNADATGGNGQDTWNGFTVTPTGASSTVQSTQDVIDVTKLLSGQSVDATNISKFVTSVTVYNAQGGKDTVIAIDRDGAGGSFNSTDILTLKNVDTTVDELIKNHQLLY
ncbi:Ig-like domain-containing protein, partial [Acinetobacter gerneri]